MAIFACDENIAGTVVRARRKHRTKLYRHTYQHVANAFVQIFTNKSAARALPYKFNLAPQITGQQFSDPVIKALSLAGLRRANCLDQHIPSAAARLRQAMRPQEIRTQFKEAQKHKIGLLCWCIFGSSFIALTNPAQRWDRGNPVLRKQLLLPNHQRRRGSLHIAFHPYLYT